MVSTIPAPASIQHLLNLFELVITRGQDEDAGVEAIRPADIGSGGEWVVYVEEMRKWPDGEDVGIEEYYFLVLNKAEYMQFREDRVQIRASWRR